MRPTQGAHTCRVSKSFLWVGIFRLYPRIRQTGAPTASKESSFGFRGDFMVLVRKPPPTRVRRLPSDICGLELLIEVLGNPRGQSQANINSRRNDRVGRVGSTAAAIGSVAGQLDVDVVAVAARDTGR